MRSTVQTKTTDSADLDLKSDLSASLAVSEPVADTKDKKAIPNEVDKHLDDMVSVAALRPALHGSAVDTASFAEDSKKPVKEQLMSLNKSIENEVGKHLDDMVTVVDKVFPLGLELHGPVDTASLVEASKKPAKEHFMLLNLESTKASSDAPPAKKILARQLIKNDGFPADSVTVDKDHIAHFERHLSPANPPHNLKDRLREGPITETGATSVLAQFVYPTDTKDTNGDSKKSDTQYFEDILLPYQNTGDASTPRETSVPSSPSLLSRETSGVATPEDRSTPQPEATPTKAKEAQTLDETSKTTTDPEPSATLIGEAVVLGKNTPQTPSTPSDRPASRSGTPRRTPKSKIKKQSVEPKPADYKIVIRPATETSVDGGKTHIFKYEIRAATDIAYHAYYNLGWPVVASGEMRVEANKKIVYIWDKSGGYNADASEVRDAETLGKVKDKNVPASLPLLYYLRFCFQKIVSEMIGQPGVLIKFCLSDDNNNNEKKGKFVPFSLRTLPVTSPARTPMGSPQERKGIRRKTKTQHPLASPTNSESNTPGNSPLPPRVPHSQSGHVRNSSTDRNSLFSPGGNFSFTEAVSPSCRNPASKTGTPEKPKTHPRTSSRTTYDDSKEGTSFAIQVTPDPKASLSVSDDVVLPPAALSRDESLHLPERENSLDEIRTQLEKTLSPRSKTAIPHSKSKESLEKLRSLDRAASPQATLFQPVADPDVSQKTSPLSVVVHDSEPATPGTEPGSPQQAQQATLV